MKKNKVFSYVMTGALSLSILGGAGASVLAATNSSSSVSTVQQGTNAKASEDHTTEKKVKMIMDQLKSDLVELGVKIPERGDKGDLFANLDQATKKKTEAIMEKERAGTITREEAHVQLEKLGVKMPERGDKGDLFANLDEATKKKAEALIAKAKEQLAELGVDHLPFEKHKLN
ncbi:hypothetical protein ACH0BF_09850 [Pseudobacillus sp. 179-B 2D1 NHS]|uniref:hypothetical protein n=1 Tax=Pseudobacillus sp. 179-B 2D1 NHS TaxID=3374292 RepID=UPI00387A25F1